MKACENLLLELIKSKYHSLHNFSLASGIPNSTLNSMLKKGIGGTAVDTVLKVFKLLECDISILTDTDNLQAEDIEFFSNYKRLDTHSKELVRMVTEHQLAGRKSEAYAPKSNEIEFPVAATLSAKTVRIYTSSASAGTGDYLDDADYIDVPYPDNISDDADFGITVNGDSMMPKINDGDVVWVREQNTIEENQIGVFVLNGNSLCKKLISIGNRYYLHSLNSKYRDIPICEDDNLKVIGRVIASTPFPAY